ncbi:TldD/PmbA family protein [Saccharolobus islandicus]|uniref:TldD/PmbA family protein n=1 Tax=Saccharolobus islandicus TaxID=43080 RepID=UPI0003762757|nr:TldD/PmbA family protein [Sulfolobus islandicus]
MNEEMVKYLQEVKGEEVGLLRVKTRRIIIKLVESKVATIQRMTNSYYFLALKKDSQGFLGRISNLNEKPKLTPVDFFPIMSKNEREYKMVRNNTNIISLFDDLSPLLSLIESEYPLYGIISIDDMERSLVTSKGFNGTENNQSISGYFRAKNREHSGQWAFSSTNFSPSQVKDSIKKANELASITGKYEISEGKYDVILSPLVMGNLMESVARMASGYAIMSGMSMLKPGEKAGSDKFTLLDTPKEDRPNSWGFDDEGTFTYNKAIIENGVFTTPLLNNELSTVFKLPSTGNAGWIYPTAWNLEVKEGDTSFESLLSGNVVFINNVWYTRFQNYTEGDFSTVARDATVVYRNGNPVGVVGRVRIADNLKKILKNIVQLSRERYSVRWWDAPMQGIYPYALVKDVRLSVA